MPSLPKCSWARTTVHICFGIARIARGCLPVVYIGQPRTLTHLCMMEAMSARPEDIFSLLLMDMLLHIGSTPRGSWRTRLFSWLRVGMPAMPTNTRSPKCPPRSRLEPEPLHCIEERLASTIVSARCHSPARPSRHLVLPPPQTARSRLAARSCTRRIFTTASPSACPPSARACPIPSSSTRLRCDLAEVLAPMLGLVHGGYDRVDGVRDDGAADARDVPCREGDRNLRRLAVDVRVFGRGEDVHIKRG